MIAPRALAEAQEAGRQAIAAYSQRPESVRESSLGAFSADASLAALVARRTLLGLGMSPRLLAWIQAFMWSARMRAKAERFLRQYAFWHGVRRETQHTRLWQRFGRGPIILMYHAVSRPGEEASHYVVSARAFARQMAWLRWRGYSVVPLTTLVTQLRSASPPPARSVAITFDDGYRDNHDVALPVLKRHGFPATVFVVSGGIGGSVSWTEDPALSKRQLLSAGQLATLGASGVEVGAHSRTHASLTAVTGDDAEREVVGCRDDLERLTGRPVRLFAYPYGDHDARSAALVERAGFDAACCSRSGINDPGTALYGLRRVEVRGTDSLWSFAFMVWHGKRPSRRMPRSRGVEDLQ